jgi:diguanylate cyclase (GGDEF)-like protein
MALGIRAKIFGAHLLVLALGAALSAIVFLYGQRALEASGMLVQEDVPRLGRIAALKQDILTQEKLLYEYYATLDRAEFLRQYRQIDSICRVGLEEIARPFQSSERTAAALGQYDRLRALVPELDATLRSADTDWDNARRLLSQVSILARTINQELDALAGPIYERVETSGEMTDASVHRIRGLVIAFSASLLAVALFVGYYVNAYIAENAERRRLAMFPERSPDPVLRLSLAGNVLYANPSTERLLRTVGVAGSDAAALLPSDWRERLAALRRGDRRDDSWQYPLNEHTLECDVHLLRDLEVFHLYLRDVTEREWAERKLAYQAQHDPLTGLPNRRRFRERLERAAAARAPFAVLLVGLDRLKTVISGFGHELGDALLQAAATRLEQSLAATGGRCARATLYRFEGDLFAVLIEEPATDEAPSAVATALTEAMRRPFALRGREFFLSLSVGLSGAPPDGGNAGTLLRNADTALQHAKRRGGNGFERYRPEMNAETAERVLLENDLRYALERGELLLHYQPQVDIARGVVTGFEALARWRHPVRGLVSPARFIPVAEDSGLIVPIGEWCLREVCRQMQDWRARGLDGLVGAVNISARQFREPGLPERVRTILQENGVRPGTIELEITEGVAMQDVEQTVATLEALRAAGVRLSLDDFGTGFSSLSYLKRFPVEKLKVDQSFVRHLITDENDAAITRAVITLGHSLGLKVLAEGVETAEQLAHLRAEGCNTYQGYYYSRPLPAEEFEARVRGTVAA